MALYKYKAISSDGKNKSGKIEANNLERAQDKLKSEGWDCQKFTVERGE